MAEQEMLLDSATIKAAVAGEKWATEKVIQHYTPMIDVLAVDEDMKQHLITETAGRTATPSRMGQAIKKNERRTQRHTAPAPGALRCLDHSYTLYFILYCSKTTLMIY